MLINDSDPSIFDEYIVTKLKAELEQLVSLNVIEKVDHPTDWVNSVVLVEKGDGSIRVCLDPKDLNKAIKCEFTQLPTPEEIMSVMVGATRFSKIDASWGYWQIALDEESYQTYLPSTRHLADINLRGYPLGYIALRKFLTNTSPKSLMVFQAVPTSKMIS